MSRAQQFLNPLMGKSFLPTDISGLQLWLKADAGTYQDSGKITPAASDGDVVGAWEDQSGNNRDFTQGTTANKPALKLNIKNGRPAIRFDGGDFLSKSLGPLDLVATNAGTIFIVQLQVGTDATNTTLAGDWSDATNRLNLHLSFSDVLYFDFGNSTAGGRISVAQPAGWDDAYHIVELYRNVAAGEINVDGANVLSANFTDSLDAAANATVSIGASPAGSVGLTGDILEIAIYNVALSAADRNRLKQYLATKYAITVT